MHHYSIQLVILSTFVFATLVHCQSHRQLQTIDENCDNGPDGLASIGAEQVCFESPAFVGERCFFLYIPQCAGKDSPLVFDSHGLGTCPTIHSFYSGWHQLAAKECFVLLYPIGTVDEAIVDSGCWGLPGGLSNGNGSTSAPCCCTKNSEHVITDDTAFLRQAAAVAALDVPERTSGNVTIDTKRIYMAGHSNGCVAAMNMGVLESDMVAAVGCHSGGLVSPAPNSYAPTPMAFIHGLLDSMVPFEGGNNYFGLRETHSIITRMNGCSAVDEVRVEANATVNSMTQYESTSCTNDADVILYALDGVGHRPFPIIGSFGLQDEGAVPTVTDTTLLLWNFMKKYALDVEPDFAVTELESTVPSTAPTTVPPTSGSSCSWSKWHIIGGLVMLARLVDS